MGYYLGIYAFFLGEKYLGYLFYLHRKWDVLDGDKQVQKPTIIKGFFQPMSMKIEWMVAPPVGSWLCTDQLTLLMAYSFLP